MFGKVEYKPISGLTEASMKKLIEMSKKTYADKKYVDDAVSNVTIDTSNLVTKDELKNIDIKGVVKSVVLSDDKQKAVFTMGDGTTKEIHLNDIKSLKYTDKLAHEGVAGMGFWTNTPGASNHEWLLNKMDCGSYGALINYSNYDAEKCRIALNTIYAMSDAVEINTPLSYSADNPNRFPFKDTIVLGNFLNTTTEGTSGTAGFAVGIAQGQNIAVVGNVSSASQVGGLHIEDASDNIVVSGNVFDGCKAEGCALYGRKLGLKGGGWYGHSVMINSNAFKSLEAGKGKGLYQTYTQYGGIKCANFANNKVEGFATGLELTNFETVNVDGCVIENCTLGVNSVTNAIQKGDVFCAYTPTLIALHKGATIDGIFDLTGDIDPMNAIRTSSIEENSFATIKRFGWGTKLLGIPVDTTIDAKLFKAPKYMKGTLKVIMRTVGGHYINLFGLIEIKNGTMTYTSMHNNYIGTFSGVSIRYQAPTDNYLGYVYLHFDNSSTGTQMSQLDFVFEGESMWEKGTTNQEQGTKA